MRMLIKSLTYVTCTCKFSHIFRQIPLLLLTSASPESSENNADAFLVLRKFGFISASGKKVIMTFAYEQERKVEGGGGGKEVIVTVSNCLLVTEQRAVNNHFHLLML